MNNLIVTEGAVVTTTTPAGLARAGQIANSFAARQAFEDYRSRKAEQTLRRQDADLALFAEFLAHVGGDISELVDDPGAWQGITWGLIEGFVRWQLQRGYAIGSINTRLATIKAYARLAARSGMIEPGELVLIRAVKGYTHKEGTRLDRQREVSRIGRKKAEAVILTAKQAAALKAQPNDLPQGRRDGLLMCLLLDHGLRCGEAAGLTVEGLDIDAGTLRFFRPKVHLVQNHRLTADTLAAARLYLQDAPDRGPLLRGSRKNGSLAKAGMSEQSITARAQLLGRQIGIEGLSAHDCRHYWATIAARNGTPLDRLQQAGGWSSSAMPLRYIEAAEVANQGVNLGGAHG